MPFPQKFTQGPWRSLPPAAQEGKEHTWYSCRVTAASGRHLADVRCGFASAAKQVECAANARLIAAAPKLVQAAIAAWEHTARYCNCFQTDGHCCGGCPMAELETAIRLATDGPGREAYLRDVSVRVTARLPEDQ